VTNIYKEFGIDVLRDSENAGPTAAEMKMAREIERLRARVEVLERVLHGAVAESHNFVKRVIKEAKP
jgi:hypothetical protein